jgi:hypothetical protein
MLPYSFVAGMSESWGYSCSVVLLNDFDIAGRSVNASLLLAFLAFLVMWVVVYMLYKMFWHADFGLPVRRRLLARRLITDRDQVAFAPIWWSDLQIQRAVSAHWRKTLRTTVQAAPGVVVEDWAAR